MPERTLLGILARTGHWLQWWRRFGPASGSDPKLGDAFFRYVLTTFTCGSNLGPAQAARHIAGVSAHELGATARHVTIGKLNSAIMDAGEQFELDAADLQGRRQAHEPGGVAGQALQLMAGFVLTLAAPLKDLEQFLLDRAMEHDSRGLLFTVAAEYLISAKTIRPGVVILAKMVASARADARALTWELVEHLLTGQCARIWTGCCGSTPGWG